VESTGEKYRFELERADSVDSWMVNHISADIPDKTVPWTFPEHLAPIANHVTNPIGYNIFNKIGVGLFGVDSNPNLPYMITSEWVTIYELSLVEGENGNRFFMSFEYRREGCSMKGKVFLATDFFLVSEGDFYFEDGGNVKDVQVKLDYDTETYRVPLPKNYYSKTSYKFFDNNPPVGVLVTERKFDLRETAPNSFKNFTLSGYGLPEPDFGERRASPFRYTLLLIWGLIIAYALWRMYRKRKEQQG